MAEDGGSLLTISEEGTNEHGLLYGIPDSFDGLSTLKWNYTGYELSSLSQHVDINANGSRIVMVDTSTNKLYCHSNDGTDVKWSYDYGTEGSIISTTSRN